MKILLDTHLLLWAAGQPRRLPKRVRTLLDDEQVHPIFSSASIWEISIKRSLGRADFQVDPRVLCRNLRDNGYAELPVTAAHATELDGLPHLHNKKTKEDPFDRILVAQSRAEGILLLTADSTIADYDGPIELV